MKKLFTFMLALAISFGLKAQTSLTQAVDFTATDVHGEEIHLFEILDRGQYVLIDFFYTTCSYCIQSIPKMVEAYSLFGCNMHDVFFMEVDYGDNENACMNWVNTYGVEYPTIAGTSGGTSINNQYGISAFPTVILIAPDHQIVIQDLYPIPNTQAIITALENHGVQQHDCNATYDPQVTITIDQVLETEVTATFTPNDDCISYGYTIATEAEIQEWMSIAGLDLPEYLWTYGIPGSDVISNTFNDLTPDTEYIIYAVPADIDGNLGAVVQEAVITTPGGGTDIMPDFITTDINGNEIHLYDILDAGQAVLINFFLYGDEFSENIMSDMVDAYRLYGCNQHDVFFMEISPNGHDNECQIWAEHFGVQYPTISRDGGGNDIAQDIPVGYYPTIMLIRPDHTFSNRDIYPPALEYIVDAMDAEGYEQHECPTTGELVMSTDTIYIDNQGCYVVPGEITITNMNSEAVQILEYTSDEFTLYCHEGEDPYYGNDIAGLFIAPLESLHVYVTAYNNMGENGTYTGTMRLITSIGDYEITIIYEENVGVEESHPNHCSLFPNPANDFVTLSGESLGTVRVYNALGQKVAEFKANSNELRINTTGYESGVYFVKTDEITLRFVVKH